MEQYTKQSLGGVFPLLLFFCSGFVVELFIVLILLLFNVNMLKRTNELVNCDMDKMTDRNTKRKYNHKLKF